MMRALCRLVASPATQRLAFDTQKRRRVRPLHHSSSSSSNFNFFFFSRSASATTATRSNMNSVQSPSLLVPVTRDEGKRTMFGPWEIATSEIFAATSLSFAFVNLKPVVSGHVLVAPRRICKRFANLSMEETADLWQLAKVVGQEIEANAETLFPDRRGKGPISLTLCIQDGPQAGQTVPHVHIHVMPRQQGDFENNDDVYDEIDASEKTLKQQLDSDRKDRSAEVMASEAEKLRKLFYN